MFRTSIAIAILALTVTAAQADPTIVRIDDLDLSRPQDTRILNSRIHDAAATACSGLQTTHSSRFYKNWFETCVSHASIHLGWQVAALAPHKPRAVASK